MLFSDIRKFVFVAVPKTGTTAIQQRLLAVDPDVYRNQVIDASGNWVKVPTHATARQIRDVMGPRADQFTFIAFLRDPYDVVVSKYHFYRSGRAARIVGLAPSRGDEPQKFDLGRTLRVLSAKALPLELWVRLYPFPSSQSFIVDANGQPIVDQVGMMEHLQEDVLRIFTPFGYMPKDLELGIANRTDYDHEVARDPQLKTIVGRRLPEDTALFERLRAQRG